MSLAYKYFDSVIGEIVNKTRLSSKKLARSNRDSQDSRYLYMTRESGDKIKDFIDLDNKRQEQIIQDAQVLKKAYLSDEVVEKMTAEIDKIFEQEYYAYTNRLHEHKNVLDQYKNYLEGIEDRVRDYEKIALQSNSELQQYSVTFDKYNDELSIFSDVLNKYKGELNTYKEMLNKYDDKVSAYQVKSLEDKELISKVGSMVDKNMDLDIKIRNEVHNELGKFNSKIQDYLEDEFTKIAARTIKAKRKNDALLGFLIASNIITILGIVALYLLK